MAFLDGRFGDALKSLRALEIVVRDPRTKLGEDERAAAKLELNLKISLTLQGFAAAESKAGKFDSAVTYLEEALTRTPSPMLSEKVLALWSASGKADLTKIERTANQELYKIAGEIARLYNYKPCNSCHSSNAPGPNDMTAERVLMELGRDEIMFRRLNVAGGGFGLPDPVDPLAIPVFPTQNDASIRNAGLKLKLTEEDQTAIQNLEAKFAQVRETRDLEMAMLRAHLADVVRKGYAAPDAAADSPQVLRRIAQVVGENGDTSSAITLYEKSLKNWPKKTDGTALEKVQDTFARAEVTHELAALLMQVGDRSEAKRLLDDIDKEIQAADVSGAKLTDNGKNLALTAKETLHLQNQFLKAECLLGSAHTKADLDAAIAMLRGLVKTPPVDLFNLDAGDPQEALIGRMQLRLGQVLLAQDPKSPEAYGVLKQIEENFTGDDAGSRYLRSEAKMTAGLAMLQAPGKTVAGIQLLREVQIDFPGSDADKTIRNSQVLSQLRGTDGLIKENINEADVAEALKVALDRSSEGPGWRKASFAGAGAIVAAVVFWEVSIPVLLIGAGVGYFAEKGVSVVEHRSDIVDAYRSGLSNVDGSKHVQNLFMLGLDVAMLVTAGAGGALARQGVRYGMSWSAARIAASAAESPFGAAALRSLAPVGKGLMYIIPAAADSTVAYTLYKGERSLILGEKFTWDAKEAFLMFALCESFAFARYAGTASKFASKSAFNQGILPVMKQGEVVGFKEASGKLLTPVMKDGKLLHYADAAGKKYFPVMQAGKVVGATNAAGKAVVWASDLMVGASTYYAMLLGANQLQPGSIPQDHLDYEKFLAEQIKTLGALHLGGKLVAKATNSALDNALIKLDKRSDALLKNAKTLLDKAPPWDPNFPGLGPQLAYAGAYGNVKPSATGKSRPRSFDPLFGPMMMANNNENGGGSKIGQDLAPFEYDLLEQNIIVSGHETVKKAAAEEVTVKIEANAAEDLPKIADAAIKHLPAGVKRVQIELPKSVGIEALLEITQAAKQKGIEVVIGELKVNGESHFVPNYRVVDGKIRILTENLPVEAISAFMLVAKEKNLEVAYGKEVVNGHIEFQAQWEYSKMASGERKLTIRASDKTPEASTRVLSWVNEAAKLPEGFFGKAEIELEGITVEAGKPVPEAVSTLLRKAMWDGSSNMRMVGGGKNSFVLKSGKSGRFSYTFSTNMDFAAGRNLAAEYLAYESARTSGARTQTDPQVAFFKHFFKQAMEHANDFYQSKTAARHDASETVQYEKFVSGPQWLQSWKFNAQAMLEFAALNRAQFGDVMNRIGKFSQPETGNLLGYAPFDGRAFADNAFELLRIFEAVERQPSSSRQAALGKILSYVQMVLTKNKYLEINGAGVGIVYKVAFGKDRFGNPDHASLNESERLLDMVNAVNTQKWPGKYRITILPEDRFVGRHPTARTRTPDAIVELLNESGTTERVVTMEWTNSVGGKSSAEIQSTLRKKIEQITNHKFASANSQGDSVVVIKFYNAAGHEAKSVTDVQDGMRMEYLAAGPDGQAAIKKIHVMVVVEGDSGISKTYWLENDGGSGWRQRSPKGVSAAKGTIWGEPLKQAMGF